MAILVPVLLLGTLVATGCPADRLEPRERGEVADLPEAGVAGEDEDEDLATGADNAVLSSKVRTALVADERLQSSDILVGAEDGVVSLSGTVPTEAEHQRAVALARGVVGVRDVEDELTVEAD